jgi:uncharacterized protein (DUF58 family)
MGGEGADAARPETAAAGRSPAAAMRGRAQNASARGSASDVRRLARFAERYTRARRWFPLTDLGVVVLGLALLAFFELGRPRSDYVIQVASATAVGCVLLALCVVLLGAWRVRARVRRRETPSAEPLRFEAGRGFARAGPWTRLPWLPLVEVETSASDPPGLSLSADAGWERVEAAHRAGADQLRRSFLIEDAFGLAAVRFGRIEARPVEVGPWLGALDSAPALAALAAGETRPHPHGEPAGDRVEMRPYVRGDPLRLVLWKVYARTGEMMVRTAERALDENTEVHAFLVPGDHDEASAAAAWVAVHRGLLGPRWRFGTPGLAQGTDDPAEALSAIARSRGREDADALDAFLAGARPVDGARVVLFAPCRPGAWLESTLASLRGLRGRVSAVVGHDGVDDASHARARRTWWVRPEARRGGEARPGAEALGAVVETLGRAGVDVTVVDRPTGRVAGAERRAVA